MWKRLLLIILIISALIYTNIDAVESFHIRNRKHRRRPTHIRRRPFRHRFYHRDYYPIHHHYTPRRRHWYSFVSDWYYYMPCKAGCVNLGNEKWGCQYPGNGVNECAFSQDCNGC